MRKEELVAVYKDTLKTGRRFGGTFKQSSSYEPAELPEWSEIEGGHDGQKATLRVLQTDTISAVLDILTQTPDADLLVLNHASEITAGGGVAKGTLAQEEDIFRCTNYRDCVNTDFYPIEPGHFVVTEGVTIFKDADYRPLRYPSTADFIAMPAVRRPGLRDGKYLDPEEYESMKLRIDLIFRYAALEGKTHLVLGALGCGAFGNPPELVSRIFKKAISEHGHYFTHIVFAILPDQKKNRRDNYSIFKAVLEGQAQAEEDTESSDEDEDED